MPTFSPDYGSVLDLSAYPGARYLDADAGGGSEGAPGRAAGYYTGGDYNPESGGFNSLTQVNPYRAAQYGDFDWSQVGDPNSDVGRYLSNASSGGAMAGKEALLWNSIPYTFRGENDPVNLGNNLWNLGFPQGKLEETFANTPYAQHVPTLNQIYANNAKFNEAASHSQAFNRDAWKGFGAFAAGSLGAAYFGAEAGAGAGAGTGEGAAIAEGGASFGGTGGASMPAAVAESDATFGGALTQTGAGQFENLAFLGGGGLETSSLLGPATGSSETAPFISSGAGPEATAFASGSGPFVPANFGSTFARGASSLFSGGGMPMTWGGAYGMSPAMSLLSLGSGFYGMNQAKKLRQDANKAFERSDPFGPYRAQYANELAALRANPNNVTKLPGYKAGLDAVERKMASQGYVGSGNMMLALHDYGGKAYDAEVGRLAELAGANMRPDAGALIGGRTGAAQLDSQSLAALGFGAAGLARFFL